MPTDLLFRADPYLAEAEARVLAYHERGLVMADRVQQHRSVGKRGGLAGDVAFGAHVEGGWLGTH